MSRFHMGDLVIKGPQFGPHEIYLNDVKVAVRDYDGSDAEEIAREFCRYLGMAAVAAMRADENLYWRATEETAPWTD